MSWFQRKAIKPSGMYKASSADYACVSCAYYADKRCHVHKLEVAEPRKQKCGDFLRNDHSIEIKDAP